MSSSAIKKWKLYVERNLPASIVALRFMARFPWYCFPQYFWLLTWLRFLLSSVWNVDSGSLSSIWDTSVGPWTSTCLVISSIFTASFNLFCYTSSAAFFSCYNSCYILFVFLLWFFIKEWLTFHSSILNFFVLVIQIYWLFHKSCNKKNYVVRLSYNAIKIIKHSLVFEHNGTNLYIAFCSGIVLPPLHTVFL